VAFAPGDGRIAVGSESGPVAVFDRLSGARLATLPASKRPARALELTAALLLAAGDDGVLRVWEGLAPRSLGSSPPAAPIHRLALSPDGKRAASAGLGGAIRIHELPSARVVETLAWHAAQITGLAWTASALVSADGNGRLAVWRF
jgi:WD40 repeat protein